MPSGGSNKLISAPETAARFGVPTSTIYEKWRAWGLPGYKIGKHLRFRERDLETWLEAHRDGGPADAA